MLSLASTTEKRMHDQKTYSRSSDARVAGHGFWRRRSRAVLGVDQRHAGISEIKLEPRNKNSRHAQNAVWRKEGINCIRDGDGMVKTGSKQNGLQAPSREAL